MLFPSGSLGNLDGTPNSTSWIDKTLGPTFFCQGLVRGSSYSTTGPDVFQGLTYLEPTDNPPDGEGYYWTMGDFGVAIPDAGLVGDNHYSLALNVRGGFDRIKLEEERWYHFEASFVLSRAGNGEVYYWIDGALLYSRTGIVLGRGHATDAANWAGEATVLSVGPYLSGLGRDNGGHSPPRTAIVLTRNHMISRVEAI